jgi:hypothetical protein
MLSVAESLHDAFPAEHGISPVCGQIRSAREKVVCIFKLFTLETLIKVLVF